MNLMPRAAVLTATIVEYAAVLDPLEQKQSLNSASGAPYTVGDLRPRRGYGRCGWHASGRAT